MLYNFLALLILIQVNLAYSKSLNKIKLCTLDYAPYQYIENNKLKGIEIEMMDLISKNIGFEVEYENVPWKRCLIGIQTGEYNGSMGVVKTEERMVYANFSIGYMPTANILFTKKKNAQRYNLKDPSEIIDLTNFTLATVRGFDYGDEFIPLLQNPKFKNKIVETNSEEESFRLIEIGKADALYSDEYAGTFKLKNMKLNNLIVPIKNKLKSTDGYIMFSKKNTDSEFINKINYQLNKIKKSGELKRIIEKYIK